jgi:hypothetical protein
VQNWKAVHARNTFDPPNISIDFQLVMGGARTAQANLPNKLSNLSIS